jgi:hypothetical protein
VTRLWVYDEKCFLLLSLNIDNVGQWPEGLTNPREMGDKPMRHGILRDTFAATRSCNLPSFSGVEQCINSTPGEHMTQEWLVSVAA